jgi:dTDP-4-dehydrorhamnose reductase
MLERRRLELWGGFECSVVRVRDSFRNLITETGHTERIEDLAQLKSLGIKRIRYPIVWETIAPDKPDVCDWAWHDRRLSELRSLGIEPIAGLLHHGSGPAYTSLLDPNFPLLFARHAQRVTARYPWIKLFTPVNEPLTTARFTCLYGHWHPHRRNLRSFLRATLNQCKAVVLAMRAIRLVTPAAELLQTEDLGKVFSTPALSYQAEFENERRWLSLDLLCGRVDRQHPLYETLLANGITDRELGFFLEWRCAPDLVGINHYVTSDRFLDECTQKYPLHYAGGNGRQEYADVEAARVNVGATQFGWKARLSEAWVRYRLPLVATEVHLGCTREDQLRWLAEAWTAAKELRAAGQDIRAVTVWALLGSQDWSSLLVQRRGHYEPGAFDIRSTPPRKTAIASAAEAYAKTGSFSHPVLAGQGWWRREARYYTACPDARPENCAWDAPQIVIVGSPRVGLAVLLHDICQRRGLASSIVAPRRIGLRAAPIDAEIASLRAWAVVSVHAAVGGPEAGLESTKQLAAACARACIPLVHISSDAVFDGQLGRAYVENDVLSPVSPRAKEGACVEKIVQERCLDALVIRSGMIFGLESERTPGDRVADSPYPGLGERDIISGSFAPDLLDATLDLLIDGERGIWHLTNPGQIEAGEFWRTLGRRSRLHFESSGPKNHALDSERGQIMPSLDDALARYLDASNSGRDEERFHAAAE